MFPDERKKSEMYNTTTSWFVRLALILPSLCALTAGAQPLNEDRKVTASDAGAGYQFGNAVALHATTAIIGAFQDDDAAQDAGSVYLFDISTGQQLFKLIASDAAMDDDFGISVAIHGTTAIVGAARDDDAGSTSGSAYLFDTTTGQQLFKLTASDAAADDFFGWSVAIFDNTAVVGAFGNDDAGNSSGSVYVFDTTNGQELFKLTASDAAALDQFGFSVAISGNTAIIGAPGDGGFAGAAYLFDTTTGQQLFKLQASDDAPDSSFGDAVAMFANKAIVGAPQSDDAGTNSGSAYLFDTTTGQQLFKLSPPDAEFNDNFGNAVSISGTTAMVGSVGDDDAGNGSGSAYLFDTSTGLQLFKLAASDGATGDEFGNSVAISGTNAIVGANGNDDAGLNSGSAYIYSNGSNGPMVLQQPRNAIVTDGETASFEFLLNSGDVTYQWSRDGVELMDDDHISGAQTAMLQIITSLSDVGLYECLATYPQGSISSNAVLLAVREDPNACAADLNGDGEVNFFDVSAFLAAYSAGCP